MSTSTGLPALDNTMGALYLGVVFAMALWGVGTVQLYYYYSGYPKDKWTLKTHVALVWVLDTVHQGLITHACYVYLVTQYGNPAYLFVIVPTLEVMVLISALVCLLVQGFLVYRVWMLSSKNMILVSALMLFVLAEFAAAISFFSRGVQMKSFIEVATIAWLSKLTNALAAAADVVIAAVLIVLLHRSRTGVRRSETIINRLIIFTVNTGLLTSFCAILAVIFVSLYPDEYIYITFYICISRMYTNSLLATLNARNGTRQGFAESTDIGSSLSFGARVRGTETGVHNARGPFAIRVDTEVENESGMEHTADGSLRDYDYPLKPMPEGEAEAGNNHSYEAKLDVFNAV
ncbi:hypothetical protein M0805_008015 [Coniferiporia weirii]|nr:hypothetical protein M0805_008015 [Coniferiporia weirii]